MAYSREILRSIGGMERSFESFSLQRLCNDGFHVTGVVFLVERAHAFSKTCCTKELKAHSNQPSAADPIAWSTDSLRYCSLLETGRQSGRELGSILADRQTDRQTSPFPILKIERQVPLINRPLRCEKEGAKRRSSASSVHGGLAQASSAFERTPSEAARLVERPLRKAWLLAGLPKKEMEMEVLARTNLDFSVSAVSSPERKPRGFWNNQWSDSIKIKTYRQLLSILSL